MSRYAFIQFAFIMFSCGWSSLQNKFEGLTFLFIPCRQKINETNFLSKRNNINIKMPIGSYYWNGTLKNSNAMSKIFLILIFIQYVLLSSYAPTMSTHKIALDQLQQALLPDQENSRLERRDQQVILTSYILTRSKEAFVLEKYSKDAIRNHQRKYK